MWPSFLPAVHESCTPDVAPPASCPRDPPLITISPSSVLQLDVGSASRSTR